MSNDKELTKKLIDDDVEDQKAWEATPVVKPLPAVKKAGCRTPCWCKCILITVGIFFCLGLIATGMTYMWMKDVVQHLTVTTPHEQYPIVEMTDAELAVVKDRVALFVDQLRSGQPASELEVSQDEINGFIGHSDYLRGNMLVTLDKNVIREEYSLPTEMLPGGKGRYYVGSDYLSLEKDGEVEVKIETAATHEDWFDGPLLFAQLSYLVENHDGANMLELFLEKGSFFGKEAPQDYIDKHENLLEEFFQDPDNEDAQAVTEGIERVSIESGKIVVKPRNLKPRGMF